MKRLVAFDYIRAISITGIILCHFLYNYDSTRSLAGWLGNTFNTIFVTMSAFLIGFKWEKENREPLKFSFVVSRTKKLSYTYYPFLLFMFLFIYFIEQHTPTIKSATLHYGFCPILQRIPNWSHLWFISLIILCYSSTYIYTKASKYIKIRAWGICMAGIISLTVVQLHNLSAILINVIVYICLYVLIFGNTQSLMSFIQRQNSKIRTIIIVLLVAICIILVHDKSFNKSNLHGVLIGVFSAILLFILMFNFFSNKKASSFINFISEISFEIYLVHYIFTLSDYSIVNHINNPFFAFTCIIIVCILSGYCLKKLSLKKFIK